MDWTSLIYFSILVVVIYSVYLITLKIIYRVFQNRDIPKEVFNGIKLIMKLISVFMVSIGLLTFIKLPSSFIITVSSVSGIIIGFASTEVISQIVSGIYLITTQPFSVRNLVNVAGTKGIVLEIGVNYTVIERFDGTSVKIPNKLITDSQIQNYTIKVPPEYLAERSSRVFWFKGGKPKKIEPATSISSEFREVLGDLDGPLLDKEIIRYPFEINFEYDLSPPDAIQRLEHVCEKYTNIFKYRPKFFIMGLSWRPTAQFRIYCANPYIIINNFSYFVADLAHALAEEVIQ